MNLYFLLFYAGIGGGALLLAGELLPRLHSLRKVATAAGLTLLTLLWLLMPSEGRGVLSVWSPSVMLNGQMILDVTPVLWWLGAALGAIFSGAAWIAVAERQEMQPLTGVLTLTSLLILWVMLLSGSILTTLISWAVFDLLWGTAALMSGEDGERVTFGLAIHGVTTLLLWAVTLLLQEDGVSLLWWLSWPAAPLLNLLLLAAMMRVGLYPFHIVFPRQIGRTRLLSLVHLAGVLSGVVLLYRLLNLPGVTTLPLWMSLWGILSIFWDGLFAWAAPGKQSPLLWAGHALLIGCVAGAGMAGDGTLLLLGTGFWLTAGTLLVLVRGYAPREVLWAWPIWLGLLLFIGTPPSALGPALWSLFDSVPWGGKLLLWVGLLALYAAAYRGMRRPALGSLTMPRGWQQAAWAVGLGIIVVAALLTPFRAPFPQPPAWGGMVLWLLAGAAAVALLRWGWMTHVWLRYGEPILELVELSWLYRALWRGMEHVLSFLRMANEISEGNGSVLWSLLMLLLFLLVVINR